MIRIQRAPWLGALPLLAVLSLVLGFALVRLVGIFTDVDRLFALWLVLGSFVALGGLIGGIHLAYRPFSLDPETRTVRIGGRTVPLDTMREATRSFSGASNGAAYLVYRFRSTDGPVVRVLVGGRPLPGLDLAGREALARFLELAPIAGPATDGDMARDALTSDILADGKKVPASAAALLGEVRAALPGAATAADLSSAPAASPDAATPPVTDDDTQADDLAALELLTRTGSGMRIARRVTGLLFGLSIVGVIVLIVVALIAGATGTDIDRLPQTGVIAMSALGIVAILGLAWSIFGDLDARNVRAAGVQWLETAEPAARERGLPAPFHGAWLQFAPGHRILTVAAFAAGVAGLLLTLGGPIAMTMGEPAVGLIAVPGLALLAFAVWFWIAHRRRRRADVAWVIDAAGPRAGLG